jgi:hypothetical protein
MDAPTHTFAITTLAYLNCIQASQLSVDLCFRFTNLIINAILFFVSKLPWFVELREVSLMSTLTGNKIYTHEPWLSRSMEEVGSVQQVSVSVAHLVA